MGNKKTNVKKNNKHVSRSAFVITTSILAAAILALGGVLTWKLLTPTSGGGDTPVVDESVSSFTFNYSPYREETYKKVGIFFDVGEIGNEDVPPFTGDVYVQWDSDDPTTKEKVPAEAKKITHTYNATSPKVYTVVISGNVERFALSPECEDFEDEDGNYLITSLNIGQSVKTVQFGAFCELESLMNVNIAGQVNKIEAAAFYDCPNLIGVEFSRLNETDKLDISDSVFMGSNNLRYIHFPKRLSYVGPFVQCTNLEEITLPEENPYFTTVHDYDGEIRPTGILVTKQAIKAPEGIGSRDYDKDGVVVGTTNSQLYEGIKKIYSLSGVDLKQLYIPKTVEMIDMDELIVSSIDEFYVEKGNTHYTDLYQNVDPETGEPYSANLLAEVKGDELSIIKLGNKLVDRIPERGVYYDGSTGYLLPVTEFAFGAADNAKITSLDLPATINKVNFRDRLIGFGWLDYHHINPFDSTLTDLTIRSTTPPECTDKDFIEGWDVYLLRDVIGEVGVTREKLLNVHIPEESIEKYSFNKHQNPEKAEYSGFWNFSNIEDSDPDNPRVFFRYTTIDSKLIPTRGEAFKWVKENYTLKSAATMFAYSKWDLAGVKQIYDLSQSIGEKVTDMLKNINDNYLCDLPWYIEDTIASCFQIPSTFGTSQVVPLSEDSFDDYFMWLIEEGARGDYVFSVKNGCLEAIQTPETHNFFRTDFDCHVKHTVKFDNNGYPIVNRFDFTNIVVEGQPIDDIFLERDYRSLSCDIEDAKIWAESRAGNVDKIVSRSMNWTIAYKNGSFNYSEITEGSFDYGTIENYIKKLAGDDIEISDLICEKTDYVLGEPIEVKAIQRDEINEMFVGFSNDGHLCIAQIIDPATISFSGDKVGKICRFNNNGICDYEAIYFYDNRIQNNSFCGYIEITNHLESDSK